MGTTSNHSVTSAASNGNTPPNRILSTLSEVARSLEAQGAHDEARALHDLREPLRRLCADADRLRYHHSVFRSRHLQPAEKLVLIDASAALAWAEANGQADTELYIPARTENVALSPKTYGRLLKKLDGCAAISRSEVRDPNGHTRIRIAPTPLTRDPLAIERPEPSNWGGKRTPRCPECGSERFKPVRWACAGCGTLYEDLPYTEGTVGSDPDPDSSAPPSAGPDGGAGGAASTPVEATPADKLSGMGNPQWGGSPEDRLSGGPAGLGEAPDGETREGGEDPGGQVVGRPEWGAAAAGRESETNPQACSEASTHDAGDPADKLSGGSDRVAPIGGEPGGEAVIPEASAGDPYSRQVPSATPIDKLTPGVPEGLRSLPQWVCWRPVEERGRTRKKPYKPRGWGEASPTDPATWGAYEQAVQAVERHRHAGVGFVFTPGDPYAGVDLDDCRDPGTGELEAWAAEIVEALDSYTEASPSGTGVHILVRGQLPPGRRRGGGVEMYDAGRYFAITGEVLGGRAEIRERQGELGALHRRLFGEREAAAPPVGYSAPYASEAASDGELLARALADGRVRRLWEGDTGAYSGDHSAADLALLTRLARFTRDPERLDRLFRRSGLYRPKWERADYRARTIARALGRA